jgi:hypothetical protein
MGRGWEEGHSLVSSLGTEIEQKVGNTCCVQKGKTNSSLWIPSFLIWFALHEYLSFIVFLSFFCESGVWTQGFVFAMQVLYRLSPFYSGYFGDGVSWAICEGWPQTLILPISAFQIARIKGMSHQCSALSLNDKTICLFLFHMEDIKVHL